MPTYDYQCKSCGYEFEYMQSITSPPLKNCPKCGDPVCRLIGTGIGLIFKGSGFYVTDYRKDSSNKNSRSSSKDEGEPEEKKETEESKKEKQSTTVKRGD